MVVISAENIRTYFNDYIDIASYNTDVKSNLNATLYKSNFLQNSIYFLKNKDENDNISDERQWLIARNTLNVSDENFSEKFNDILKYSCIPENLLPAVYIPFYQSSGDITSSINFNILTLDNTLPDTFYGNTYKTFDANIRQENTTSLSYFVDNNRKLPSAEYIAKLTIDCVKDVILNYTDTSNNKTVSVSNIITSGINIANIQITNIVKIYLNCFTDESTFNIQKLKEYLVGKAPDIDINIINIIANVVYAAVKTTVGLGDENVKGAFYSLGIPYNKSVDISTYYQKQYEDAESKFKITDYSINKSLQIIVWHSTEGGNKEAQDVRGAFRLANQALDEDYNYVRYAAALAAAYTLIGSKPVVEFSKIPATITIDPPDFSKKLTEEGINRIKIENKTKSRTLDDKKDLQDLLHNQIKNLNDPTKTYNNFDLTTMIIFVCILWFVIILTLLKIVHYYYSEYYNIIIIVMTVLMLIGTIIWKMSNVIRS